MHSSTPLTLAAFAALATTAVATSHDVNVAQSGLSYSPDTIQAAVGDTVNFHFLSAPHSVAQADFAKPCQPSSGGVWSGIVSNSGPSAQVWQINITTTDPLYFYCAVATHCAMGMSMAINPPASGNTLAAFQSAAKSASSTQPPTVEGGKFVAAAAVGSASGASSAASATATASGGSGGSGGVYGSGGGSSSTPSTTSGAAGLREGWGWGAVVLGVLGGGGWVGFVLA